LQSGSKELLRIWAWPTTLGVLTASGLVSALVFESWGDAWSWLALGLPLALAAWCIWFRAPPGPSSPRH